MMNQKFKIVLVKNGITREVGVASSYTDAISYKKKWMKSNPGDQLVIQPKNSWE